MGRMPMSRLRFSLSHNASRGISVENPAAIGAQVRATEDARVADNRPAPGELMSVIVDTNPRSAPIVRTEDPRHGTCFSEKIKGRI
jgi:hypothetical protein